MEIPEKELEIQLLDAGKKILSPLLIDSELLDSLNLLENLLARVEQSPSKSLREAVIPASKALVAAELLRHSDVDVKVAVASCISEITRITAPDAPYDDDEMKAIFQLIVSSFENLDDKLSRSYSRRISVLETLAKVRSCVVMLDLECDDLIVEMIQLFFRTIREDHFSSVFSSMETIMTLVLEESEDISVDLLSQFLNILKKDNEEVLPVACQLAEKVFVKCGRKIKPYLLPAVKASGASLDDYRKVVTDVLHVGNEAVESAHGDSANKNTDAEDNLVNAPSEKADEVAIETMEDAPPSEEAGSVTAGPPKTVMSNGILEKGNEDAPVTNDDSKEADLVTLDESAEPSKTTVDIVTDEESPKSENKPEKASRRKGRKPSSTKSSLEPVEPVLPNRKLEVIDIPEHQKNVDKVIDDIPIEDPKIDTRVAASSEQQPDVPVPQPAISDNACVEISSPSLSGSLDDEIRSKMNGLGKRKEHPLQEDKSFSDVDSKEAAGLEDTLKKHAIKKSTLASDKKESVPDSSNDTKKDDKNELVVTSANDLAQEAEVGVSQPVKKKIRSQPKVTPVKRVKKSTPKAGIKKTVSLSKSTPKATKDMDEALKSSAKRKHPGEEKTPETKMYGPDLVGAKVEVWWPDDMKFYKGEVKSFNAASKEHKIYYDDGDVEVLNLKNEIWNRLDDSEGRASDGGVPHESAVEMRKGKKAKTSADAGTSKGKSISSTKTPKASLSKSKTTPKSRPKAVGKYMADTLAIGGISDIDKSGKSDTPKLARKSKDDDNGETPKGSIKSKQQDGHKAVGKYKAKSPKIVSKSNPTTASENPKAESLETEKTPEISKEKSQSTSKSKQVGPKAVGKYMAKSQKSVSKSNPTADSENPEAESLETEKTPEMSKEKSQSTSKSEKSSRKIKQIIKDW